MQIAGLVMALAFSGGGAVFGGWWCAQRLRAARYLLNTPTSKIRSAAQGYTELYGVLQEVDSAAAQLAPLTGQACLWWRYRIERYEKSGKHKRWRLLESGSSSALLCLQDGTGDCLIDPRGAEIRPLTRQRWQGDRRQPLAGQHGGSGFLVGLLLGEGQYRYTEERLHAGQPLYAIGELRTLGGVEASNLDQAQAAVVREWKGDFAGLLRRFDSNADGQLDEEEWQRMRQSARAEAQRRLRARGEAPVHNQLRQPGSGYPFILSSFGEDALVRSFCWQALGGALLCLLGALACAWLVRSELLPLLG